MHGLDSTLRCVTKCDVSKQWPVERRLMTFSFSFDVTCCDVLCTSCELVINVVESVFILFTLNLGSVWNMLLPPKEKSPDSDHRSLIPWQQPPSMPSSPPSSGTAMESCSGFLTKPWTDFSASGSQLPEYCKALTSPPPYSSSTGSPVKSWVTYKILILTCKPLNNMAPHYLADLPVLSALRPPFKSVLLGTECVQRDTLKA